MIGYTRPFLTETLAEDGPKEKSSGTRKMKVHEVIYDLKVLIVCKIQAIQKH